MCVWRGVVFFWRFFFSFYKPNIISCPAYLPILIPFIRWLVLWIYSLQGRHYIVFSYYENELPRHIGHGHSPSSSCYLCCVCVLHHFEMGLAQSSQCSFFNRLWALFFGIYPQLQLSSKFQPHNVVLFLFRCLTASEESLLKLLNSTH